MIITETKLINGKDFIHTYSDTGYKIKRNGELYDDAYDPAEFGRKYEETNIPINTEEDNIENSNLIE